MSSCTFLKVKDRYINPDKLRMFHSYSEDSTLVSFTENDYIILDISIENFVKMLQESNWFVKE